MRRHSVWEGRMAEQLLCSQEELTFMDLLSHKSGRL